MSDIGVKFNEWFKKLDGHEPKLDGWNDSAAQTKCMLSGFEAGYNAAESEATAFVNALIAQHKLIADISDEIGIFGMPGSPAWISQMRKLKNREEGPSET